MARALLTIDLDALAANWQALARASGAAQAGAVVKADAYGLGLAPVATRLAEAGARVFFVALAEEGAELRQALGPGPEIHVFSGHMAGDAALIAAHDLIPLLNSPAQVARHLEALPDYPFGLQLDTGMNRLGLEPHEFRALAERVLPLGPRLLQSHLACSDEADQTPNAAQLAVFRDLTDGLGIARSLAATGGILLGADYHFDITRPGIGVYGARPFTEARHVVRLDLPVIQTRTLARGEGAGYGFTWRAQRDTLLATVAAGYADGILRALSNRISLYAGERPCPLVGRVSMDLLTIDVTDLDEVPESLCLLGPGQGVDELADAAGTIGYEVLTSLGARYERSYTGGA